MTGQDVQWQYERVLMSVDKVAEELDLDPSSVRRLFDSGDLAYVDISPTGAKRRTLKVEDTELARFIASRRRNTPPEPEA